MNIFVISLKTKWNKNNSYLAWFYTQLLLLYLWITIKLYPMGIRKLWVSKWTPVVTMCAFCQGSSSLTSWDWGFKLLLICFGKVFSHYSNFYEWFDLSSLSHSQRTLLLVADSGTEPLLDKENMLPAWSTVTIQFSMTR